MVETEKLENMMRCAKELFNMMKEWNLTWDDKVYVLNSAAVCVQMARDKDV